VGIGPPEMTASGWSADLPLVEPVAGPPGWSPARNMGPSGPRVPEKLGRTLGFQDHPARHSALISLREMQTFQEVLMVEVREALRLWLIGHRLPGIARLAQIDRKTVRRYPATATAAGLTPEVGDPRHLRAIRGRLSRPEVRGRGHGRRRGGRRR
jgi:hypothetical protein